MSDKKGFFARHAKSSAALVSIAIHAILVVIALSFVAVSVVKKKDVDFEVKQVNRPQMKIRKLQVPVKQRTLPQPKLRKQIVASPKLNRMMPNIKMPEIIGVRGGLGNVGQGLGGAASLGFSMPEINLFGVKKKSERIMLILDGSRYMSSDDLGGAKGFEVIKTECLKLIERLPPTAVFNIAVYGGTRELFPNMVPATPDNVQKAKDWLTPLNQVKGAKTKYGVDTLGPGGTVPKGTYPFGKFKKDLFSPRGWNEPVFLAMADQADTVFLLTGGWGFFGYDLANLHDLRQKWNETSAGKDWNTKVAEGRKKLKEENEKRKAAGQASSSLNPRSELDIVRKYYPGTEEPPHGERVFLGVRDLVDAFKEAYKTYAKEAPKLGIEQKNKPRFSLNVIFFAPENSKDDNAAKRTADDEGRFKELARSLNGEFRTVAGLKAIESYVK